MSKKRRKRVKFKTIDDIIKFNDEVMSSYADISGMYEVKSIVVCLFAKCLERLSDTQSKLTAFADKCAQLDYVGKSTATDADRYSRTLDTMKNNAERLSMLCGVPSDKLATRSKNIKERCREYNERLKNDPTLMAERERKRLATRKKNNTKFMHDRDERGKYTYHVNSKKQKDNKVRDAKSYFEELLGREGFDATD